MLQPVVLNQALGAHFANLAMNDATVYEQARLMNVFRRAHPNARFVLVGLDVRWCVTGESYLRLTPRPFPSWMYGESQWAGYAHMLNMYAIQEAGQLFGILMGMKRPVYGRDGFTSFVPPDSEYDPARVAEHLQREGPNIPRGERSGPLPSWRYPALETLELELRRFPSATRKLVFFVPYNHMLIPPAATPGALVWSECKRRVAQISRSMPSMLALDFMRASPITDNDDNYWDGLHYRLGIGDRISRDIGAGVAGRQNADFKILADQGVRHGGT